MRPTTTDLLVSAVQVACVLGQLCAAGSAVAQASGTVEPASQAGGRSRLAPEATVGANIVAVVNGDVVSRADVENRRKLFALSSGLPTDPELLQRLTPRITQQLVDERLRLQEMQRRHVVVGDAEIAAAIRDVEQRNGMVPGTLQSRLGTNGVEFRTLIDQVRVQLGWARVLRQQIGAQADVGDADVAERTQALKAQIGQPEFRVGEIFVPTEGSQVSADTQRFVDTVIQELRAGAPFAIAAAQFSQSQTALQGGDLGWVQPNQLDPEVSRVVAKMPVGAVSNPIKVPGGYSIVTLRGERQIGRDTQPVLRVRQVFLPFSTRLDPRAPTDQQKQMLAAAKTLSAGAKDCGEMEAANARYGGSRPADPGPVQLETLAPALRSVLERLQPQRASEPLVATDGIALVMVCSRETRAEVLPGRAEIADRILSDRIELASRQLMQDLQRRAIVDRRG